MYVISFLPQRFALLSAILFLPVAFSLGAQDLSSGDLPSLTLTATVQGQIEQQDYDEDSGNYIDWYALKVKKGQRLFLGLASKVGDAKLYLKKSESEMLDNDDSIGVNSQLFATAERDGIWHVGASMLFSEESEDFSVPYVLYARDYSKSARVLGLDRAITGSLVQVSDIAPPLPDEFTFAVPSDGIYAFSLTGRGGMKAYLRIEEQTARQKTFVAQIEGDSPQETATIRYYLIKGRKYLLQAAALPGDRANNYSLLVKQDTKALALKAGQVLKTNLETMQTNFYLYAGKAGELVELVMSSNDFDTYLVLEDEQGQELRYDDDIVQDADYASIGNYYFEKNGTLIVSTSSLGSSASGKYDFVLKSSLSDKTLLAPKDFVQNSRLSPGQTLVARLSSKSSDNDGFWANYHSIQVKANELVQIKLDSRDFDGRLEVISPDGEASWFNDDMNGLNSMVEFIAPVAGLYKVRANSYLSIKEPANRIYSLAYNSLGSTKVISAFVEGEIAEDAETDDEGLAYKEYSYKFAAGQTLYVLAYSDEFAVKLDLIAANGELMDSNSNFGDASNARLLAKIEKAGSYKIRVVNQSTEEGVYGGNFLFSLYEVR